MPLRRGVVLDRDGTIIDVVRDAELGVVVTAFHPDQLRLLPGALDGMRRLADAGYVLAIATNQPGAAKGQVPLRAIERTNSALVEVLQSAGVPIAAVAVCPHHPEGGPGGDPRLIGPCACRKPSPGLLLSLMRDLELDVASSWMIGDSASDMAAAQAAGLRAGLLIDTGRCELCPLRSVIELGRPDQAAPRLDLLAEAILTEQRQLRVL